MAGDATVLSTTTEDVAEAEANVPDLSTTALILTGLAAAASTSSSSHPLGSRLARRGGSPREATEAGLIHAPWKEKDGRLRLRRLRR